MAAEIPGADLKILPGVDHLPWVGDWAAVMAEILAFVSRSRRVRADRVRADRVRAGR